jgi:hypothetical protein
MFDSGTLNLFVAITIFVIVTVLLRDRLAGRSIGGQVLTKTVAQFIGGAAGLAVAVAFLVAVG